MEKLLNNDEVSGPTTSPLLKVRVHVPLTISAGKCSESSGPYDLRMLVLIYCDRQVRNTKKPPASSRGCPRGERLLLGQNIWYFAFDLLWQLPYLLVLQYLPDNHHSTVSVTVLILATRANSHQLCHQVRFIRICISPDVAWTRDIISLLS